MNRILFEESEIVDGEVTFSDMRAEHVLDVLHGSVGQKLKTGVIDGKIGVSEITGIEGRSVTVRCEHREDSLAPWVDLLLAPPRPRVMKRLLPQLATLGVRRIVLVGAEKVEKMFWGATLLKEEEYRPLLIDGLMQAGTTALPTIQCERSFFHYVSKGRFEEQFASSKNRIVAHPYGANGIVRGEDCSEPLLLAVGPEGGWTDREVALLEEHNFARLSLGPRILRTDTALIALLARLM